MMAVLSLGVALRRHEGHRVVSMSTAAELTWRCVPGCGACCYLAEEEREGLSDWLSAGDLATYRSMVAADGWCKHFDHRTRACTIYEDRPWFCRVSEPHFLKMYGVDAAGINNFCIDCCRAHIEDVHGRGSRESARFERALREDADDEEPPLSWDK